MTEGELVSEIKRIGSMHYSLELADRQELLKYKLKQLRMRGSKANE